MLSCSVLGASLCPAEAQSYFECKGHFQKPGNPVYLYTNVTANTLEEAKEKAPKILIQKYEELRDGTYKIEEASSIACSEIAFKDSLLGQQIKIMLSNLLKEMKNLQITDNPELYNRDYLDKTIRKELRKKPEWQDTGEDYKKLPIYTKLLKTHAGKMLDYLDSKIKNAPEADTYDADKIDKSLRRLQRDYPEVKIEELEEYKSFQKQHDDMKKENPDEAKSAPGVTVTPSSSSTDSNDSNLKHEVLERDKCPSEDGLLGFHLSYGNRYGPKEYGQIFVKEGEHIYKAGDRIVSKKDYGFHLVNDFTITKLLNKMTAITGEDALKLIPKDAPSGKYCVYKLEYKEVSEAGNKPDHIVLSAIRRESE